MHGCCCINFKTYSFYREKPQDVEWMELFEKKKPLLLNYAQCKLNAKDYYPAIEYCSEILKYDPCKANYEQFVIFSNSVQFPANVKAVFRRGKAHLHAWNIEEARKDFRLALELDPNIDRLVNTELKTLDEMEKSRNLEDKEKYKNLFK